MKIAYVLSSYTWGGPFKQLCYTIQYLDRKLFEPVVIVLSPTPRDPACVEAMDRLGVEVHGLAMSRLKGLIEGKRALARELAAIEPAIVHSQGIRADCMVASLKIPRHMCTIRNYAYEDYPMKFGALRGRLMAWSHTRALRRIPVPVACSRNIAMRVGALLGEELTYVQNGVVFERFSLCRGQKKQELRRQLGLPETSTVFISVGALVRRKATETVIEAFLRSSAAQNALLLFAGDGPLRQQCEEQAHRCESIRFIGNVPDIERYLAAADVFVSASVSEGLPNAVLEAGASGLPLILSDIPPHREVVDGLARGATLFPIGDIGALTAKLDNVPMTDYAGTSEQVRRHVQAHFDASSMSQSYQDLYRHMEQGMRA